MKINQHTAQQREIDHVQWTKKWRPHFLFWPRRARNNDRNDAIATKLTGGN